MVVALSHPAATGILRAEQELCLPASLDVGVPCILIRHRASVPVRTMPALSSPLYPQRPCTLPTLSTP